MQSETIGMTGPRASLTVVSSQDTMFPVNEQTIGTTIRRLRSQSGFTLTEVAEKAGITKGALSKIETGQTSSAISTLIRIAQAIDVQLADFFADDEKRPAYVLTRKDQGQFTTRDGSKFGYSYEALALDKGDKYVEPFVLTINPGDPPGEFYHRGQEFIYMLSGRLEFTVGDDTMILKTGDSLYFDANTRHQTKILGSRPVRFLCTFIQPSARTKP